MGRRGRIIGALVGVIALATFLRWLIVPMTIHLEMAPDAYSSWIDRTIIRTGYSIRGRPPPCLVADGGYWDGTIENIEVTPWDQCLRFTEQRRWQGVAEFGLENSRFCAGENDRCPPWEKGTLTWLEFAPGSTDGFKLSGAMGGYGVDRIEFIGRRTMYPGQFGHLGQSDYHMIVDRVTSLKQIEGPPPQLTKTQVVAAMKACEANHTCIPDWDAINRMDDGNK